MKIFRFIAALLIVLLDLAPNEASSAPNYIPAVPSINAMKALGSFSPQYAAGLYVTSQTAGGIYVWVAGNQSSQCPATGLWYTATGVASTVGCWELTTPAWALGGSTSSGGGVFIGSINAATVAGSTVARSDAQIEVQNVGNTHGLIDIFNTYKPCTGTPIHTFTGSIATTVLTSSINTLTTGNLICGSIGSFGAVSNGTTVVSGSSSPYTINNSQTVGSQTMYEYPMPQESSYANFGYDSSGVILETSTMNTTWAGNNNSSVNGQASLNICTLGYTASVLGETCQIHAFANNSVALGSGDGGGNYALPPANTTVIEKTGLVNGALTVGVQAANPQLIVGPSPGFSSQLNIVAPSTALAAVTAYYYTSGTQLWTTGLQGGAVTDFQIYDTTITAPVVLINAGTGVVNFPYGIANGTFLGVTCAGSPSGSFASKLGIVTHC